MILLLIVYLAIVQLVRQANNQNIKNGDTKTVSQMVYTNSQLREIGRHGVCITSPNCLPKCVKID